LTKEDWSGLLKNNDEPKRKRSVAAHRLLVNTDAETSLFHDQERVYVKSFHGYL